MRVGLLSAHPVQYNAPFYRALAQRIDLTVFYAHQPDARQQGAGFGQPLAWDIDLTSGYDHHFLINRSPWPGSTPGAFFGAHTPELYQLIRRDRFDAFIVTGWYLLAFWEALLAGRLRGVPVLARGDSQLGMARRSAKRALKGVLFGRFLRQFSGFLSVGQRFEAYLRHYGVPQSKIFHVPHCVDDAWFANQAEKARRSGEVARLRETWGASFEEIVVLFAGKLIDMKHPLDAWAAAQQARERGVAIRLVVVGSGELERELRARAEAGSVPVHFAGFQNQQALPAYYAAADALVLPSDERETWGLVVNESFACGTPAIVSEACGCAPDLIDPRETGYVFALGDIDALASCFERMGQLKHQGHCWQPALSRKRQRFSIEAAVAGTIAALEAVGPSIAPGR